MRLAKSYNKNILPDDIKETICKKYHISEYDFLSLYYTWWRCARILLKADIKKIDKAEDVTVYIPHIGKIEIRKKYFQYVQLQRRNAEVQSGDNHGEEV